MLQPLQNLESVRQAYDRIRDALMGEVDTIASELEKTSRRNATALGMGCIRIDGLTRDYRSLSMQINTLRMKEEAQCKDNDAVIELRRTWGPVVSRTSLFQNELNQWRDVQALVKHQLKPKRQKLYYDDERLPKITFSQALASDDVFNWLHAILNPEPQSEEAADHKCFPDIGLSNSEFHQHMHAAYRLVLAKRRANPVRFLDVGCGGGLKVYSALRYFEEAHGFDFDPAYVEMGKRFLAMDRQANATVFEQDALTYDDYGSFDVIYFYRPASNDDMLYQMEQRIVEQSRPGTVLIAPYKVFTSRFDELGCGRVDGYVYLSKTSQAEADKWRRKAERIGEFIVKEDTSPLRTIWEPILDVSRRNGFDIPYKYKKPKH